MRKVILAKNADRRLIEYLGEKGYDVELFGPIPHVAEPLSCHPDMLITWLGHGCIFRGESELLAPSYPGDIRYNAASTGKYFLHNLKYTDPALLESAKNNGLKLIDVRQGYAKCSTCVVNPDSIITYDKGIAVPARAAGMDVLEISPGYIELPGFDTGFIGGCSGHIGETLVFSGDLSAHPDFDVIKEFVYERNIELEFFAEYPLTDIGSIIEA